MEFLSSMFSKKLSSIPSSSTKKNPPTNIPTKSLSTSSRKKSPKTSSIITGLDNNNELVQELDSPISSVKIVLYRINNDFKIPYFEIVLSTEEEEEGNTFPECSINSVSKSLNSTRQTRNQIYNFIETKIFAYNDDSELPKFKGFSRDLNHVFYDVTLLEKNQLLLEKYFWGVESQISPKITAVSSFFEICKNGKEIVTKPIQVYATNNQWQREEKEIFGYCFYFKKEKVGEFKHSHLLFLPRQEKIFYIQKDELQNIDKTLFENYDFSNYECIEYTEDNVKTWCIKNILSFFPIQEETAAAAAASRSPRYETVKDLLGNPFTN